MKTYKQNAVGTFDKYINGALVGHCLGTDTELLTWCGLGNVPTEYTPPVLSYRELRRDAYLQAGITTEAIVFALREKIGENRSEAFDSIQSKVSAIKLRHPKP